MATTDVKGRAATRTLYLVVREHRYDGGSGRDALQNQTPLYCGYNRLKAARFYFAGAVTDSGAHSPGSYYTVTRCRKREVAAG